MATSAGGPSGPAGSLARSVNLRLVATHPRWVAVQRTARGEAPTGPFHADDAGERIERAAHTAHTIGCHLRLLITACSTPAGAWLRLSAGAFADGMHELSACTVELAEQLDAMPVLADGEVRQQVDECWRIAIRVGGLLRLLSDAACESRLLVLEVGADSLMGSLQHWAERMQRIEGTLEGMGRRAVPRWAGAMSAG